MQSEQGSILQFDEPGHPPNVNFAIYARLNELLGTTHSLEQLLDTFFFEVQHWISSDGMRFSYAAKKLSHDVGSLSRNKCHYRLYRGSNYLGEICFARRTRFKPDELALIEEVITVLSKPLQMALTHHTTTSP